MQRQDRTGEGHVLLCILLFTLAGVFAGWFAGRELGEVKLFSSVAMGIGSFLGMMVGLATLPKRE